MPHTESRSRNILCQLSGTNCGHIFGSIQYGFFSRVSLNGNVAAHLYKCSYHYTLFCRLNPEADVTLFSHSTKLKKSTADTYGSTIYRGIAIYTQFLLLTLAPARDSVISGNPRRQLESINHFDLLPYDLFRHLVRYLPGVATTHAAGQIGPWRWYLCRLWRLLR